MHPGGPGVRVKAGTTVKSSAGPPIVSVHVLPFEDTVPGQFVQVTLEPGAGVATSAKEPPWPVPTSSVQSPVAAVPFQVQLITAPLGARTDDRAAAGSLRSDRQRATVSGPWKLGATVTLSDGSSTVTLQISVTHPRDRASGARSRAPPGKARHTGRRSGQIDRRREGVVMSTSQVPVAVLPFQVQLIPPPVTIPVPFPCGATITSALTSGIELRPERDRREGVRRERADLAVRCPR